MPGNVSAVSHKRFQTLESSLDVKEYERERKRKGKKADAKREP